MKMFKGSSQLMQILVNNSTSADTIEGSEQAFQDPRIVEASSLYEDYFSDDEEDDSSIQSEQNLPEGDGKSALSLTPFRFTAGFTPSLDPTKISAMCAVGMFNLGLVFHLDAVDSINYKTSVSKALHLYDFAYKLLLTSDGRFVDDHLFYKRLMMALLNNLAFINFELMCYDTSSKWLNYLSLLAADLRGESTGVVAEECQSFLLNAMILQPPSQAPAA